MPVRPQPIISEVLKAMSDSDDLTIGIEIMPGETTPARGISLPPDPIPFSDVPGITDEDVARISADVAENVREMVMERIEHIIRHAVTEAVEAQLKKFVTPV